MSVLDSITRESDPPSRNLALASERGSAARATTRSVSAHTVESSATNRASLVREDCMMRRPIAAAFLGIVTSLLIASSALAHECTNASKSDPAAGAQALIDANTGEVLWMTEGLANRLALGVVDPVTGEGLHGLIAFDATGDGIADFSTWVEVGPDGEVPLVAQLSGPACRGLTNLFLYFTVCVGS
jgi:hypothetical protein